MKPLLFLILFVMCLPLAGQTPAFDDLTMVDDEITAAYHSSGKNYVFIRSKRGTNGLNKTSSADSIKTFPIKEIVLVFTEVNESAFDEREDANRERWENLLKTYPEFFKPNTTYKNICQCKIGGDSVAFKKVQGFYVYFTGQAKATETAPSKVEEKKVEDKKVVEKKAEEKKPEDKKAVEKKAEEKKVVVEEKKAVEETKTATATENNESSEETVKTVTQKKAPVGKARRAKDPKACRPACYGDADDDLNNFFKISMEFTKKERKHIKNLSSIVKIHLNVDGSVKKTQVTGEDAILNKKVESALGTMNNWHPAVKNGVTVRSEIKITLKYDKESKGMKPFETVINPRPGPKCKCASDAEMFGSE